MKPRRIFSAARLSFPLASALVALLAPQAANAQTIRTWIGAPGGAWHTVANWNPNTTFAGAATAVVAGEGLATDIMAMTAANIASNIGINMSTMGAAGGVGLTLGGIDFNKTDATALQIGNSSTTVNGILQLNGATINSVAKTLIRVAGSANLTIANVNSGTGTQTMGLRLGITDGIFDVGTSRTLTISSIISEAATNSGFTKTGAGQLTLTGVNTFTGGITIRNGTVSGGTTPFSLGTGGVTMGGAGSTGATLIGGQDFSPNVNITVNAPTSGNIVIGANGTGSGMLVGSVTLNSANVTIQTFAAGIGASTTVKGITGTGNVILNNLNNGASPTGRPILSTNLVNHTGTITNQGAGSTTTLISSEIGSNVTGVIQNSSTAALQLSGANTNYAGSVTISNGTLSLANADALGSSSGISMAAGTTLRADLGITTAAPITLSGAGNATISAGTTTAVTANFNGGISGSTTTLTFSSGNNTSNPAHVISLGATSNYTGNTTITVGNTNNTLTVRAGATDSLSQTTALTFGQVNGSGTGRGLTYDLNGNNQTLTGLSNTGLVPQVRNMRVTSTNAATLTINNTEDFTYGGATIATSVGTAGTLSSAQIIGAISLVKNGTGTFTLGGTLTSGAGAQGNTFTGNTTVLGGILVLGESVSIRNSVFDTGASITGDASNGLRAGISGTGVTTLTLGGLSGNKNFADVFTSTTRGYSNLTGLTLNPNATQTPSYSGNIADATTGMTLTKSGAGTQTLGGSNSFTGGVTINAGTLQLGSSGALNSTAGSENAVTFGPSSTAILALGGNSVGMRSLNSNVTPGTPVVENANAANATLTIGNSLNLDSTFAGVIRDGTGGGTLGLSKAGNGTLTLPEINTYTGATNVTAGTLTLSGTGEINGSSGITVNVSGAKLLQNSGTAISPVVTLTQGTLTGNGTVNTVNAAAGVTISNNNGVAGASLTIGALSFADVATVNTFANSASAPIVTTSLSTGAGVITINASSTGWANGANNLISYAGSIGGSGFTGMFTLGAPVTGLSARQTQGSLIDTGSAVALNIIGDSTVWSGFNGANWITTATNDPVSGTANWALKTAMTASDFWAADNAEFNDTYNVGSGPVAVTQTAVDISAADVSPTTASFNNSIVNYSLGSTGGFAMTGTGSLTKNGTGTLTITNANTYTGFTTINGGTLQIDNAGALGTTGTIAFGGGTLKYGTGITTDLSARLSAAPSQLVTIDTNGNDVTFASALTSVGGTLTKTGANTLTLTGANTYTGATVINAGTLQLGSGSTTGALSGTSGISGTGTLAINRTNAVTQALDLNGAIISGAGLSLTHAGTSTLTLSGNNSYGGGTSITGTNAIISVTTNADALGSGDVTFAGGRRLVIAAGLNVANDIIIGSNSGEGSRGMVESSGTGTATLSGNITINNGAVAGGHFASSTGNDLVLAGVITSSVTVAQRLGTVTYVGGGTGYTGLFVSGTGKVGALNGIATTATVDIGTSAAGTLDLNGFNQSLAGITKGANAATIGNSSTTTDSTLTTTGTSTFAGVIQNVIGSGTRTVGLTVNGGALTLTGANTYTGGTTVTGSGTLTANVTTTANGIGSSPASVDNGAALVLNNTNTSTTAVAIANTFTGAGLLKLQFAASTTNARGTTTANVTGFNGTIQLSSLGTTSDKWNAIGLGTVPGSLVVDSGNTIFTNSGTTSFTGGITLNGSGNNEGHGAIRLAGATTVLGGNISLASSSTISSENVAAQVTGNISSSATGTTLTLGGTSSTGGILSGNISDGTGTLAVTQAVGSYNLSGNLSHSGGVNVTNGLLTLSGASNTYSGITAVSAGVGRSLLVTANNALGGTGAGNETTIGAAAQLGFSGGITYAASEKVIGSGAGNTGAQGVFLVGTRGFIQSVSGNNTFAGDIELNANGVSRIGTQDGASLTLTGAITQGAGVTTANILFRAGNTAGDFVTLSNAGNSFGGDSTVFSGLADPGYAGVRLGVSNALPTNLTITSFSGTGAGTALDLNGKDQSLNGLLTGSGAGGLNIINMDTVTASTLTLNPTADKSTDDTLILGGGGLGTINVVKDGTFTQTLGGTHSYTGTTTVLAGTLVANNNTAFGTGSAAVGAASGADASSLLIGVDLVALGNNLTVNSGSSGTKTIGARGAGGILGTFNGSITLNDNVTLLAGGNATTTAHFNSLIQGTGSVTVDGTGIVELHTANTYGGSTNVLSGATLQNHALNAVSTVSGLTVNAGGTYDLGSYNQAIASLSGAGGVLNSINGASTLTVSQSTNTTFSGALQDGGVGKVLGLTKADAGTLNLTGANTYTGATAVSAGTLALVGGSQASPVTVSSGASLGFTLGSPTSSTSTFDLTTGTIKITGTPTLPSYTLITSSAGITGDPVLDTPIAGYALYVDGNSLLLTTDPYALWAAANNATGGKTGDPDGDLIDNLTEYAFGTDPQSGVQGPIAYSGGVVTAVGNPVVEENAGVWYAVFGRRTDYVAAGLVYTVEFGAGLDQWTASVTVPTTVATNGVIDAVRVPFPNFVPTLSGPKKPTFFRVDISETP